MWRRHFSIPECLVFLTATIARRITRRFIRTLCFDPLSSVNLTASGSCPRMRRRRSERAIAHPVNFYGPLTLRDWQRSISTA